jgi:hypothetical protein
MSGPNHHHIPQFLQRSFGAAPKGRQKEIWQHAKCGALELRRISDTAADDYFYSAEVDEKITKVEDGLAKLYHVVRAQSLGSTVDAESAAALITHLAPRSSHLRESFATGLNKLATGAQALFTDPDQIEQLLGLHEDEPTERFREKLRESLRDMPQIEQAGLPGPVLERVAFYVAKENFDSTVEEGASWAGAVLSQMATGSTRVVRDGHIRALDDMDAKPNVRRDLLATFNWTIEPAPGNGAVLPDCVALAYAGDAHALPMMFAGKEMEAIVMPLTKDRLLVGRNADAAAFAVANFNADAAACSQSFFLAHSECAAFAALNPLIGTRCEGYFADVMQDVFQSVLPQPSGGAQTDEIDDGAHLPREADLQFSCSIICTDFGDEDIIKRVGDGAAAIIRGLARTLPLSRLDSAVFAFDYPAALRSVDRGDPALAPVEAIHSGEEGCVGRMLAVKREGKFKACIVFNANVAACLISENDEDRNTAMMMIVHQLILVAMIELVDRALPGVFEGPIKDDLQAALYGQVRDSLTGYIASRLSAGFGNTDEVEAYQRQRLIAAVDALKSAVDPERLSYRYHGDLDGLLSVALPAAGQVLSAASDLLGVCAGAGLKVMGGEGALQAALDRANLSNWLPFFARDLERFFARLGGWRSLDEFLAFNRHVERLLWSVGLFPWNSPEGGRIEVPYFTDAEALLADLAETAR